MKALVTGASSGIGKEISKYLIELGYDLYVVSNDEKIKELYNNSKTTVMPIVLDLTSEDNCYKLYEKLKKENINVVINNSGFGLAGNFTETSLENELKMIDLNIKAYHILTKLFLKDFVIRDKGRLLNVASMAGFMPGPYMDTYYATKAYVLNLSLGIYEELKRSNSNVKISIFCPGPVKTNFENVANVKFNIREINANYAAKYAIDNMFKNKLIIIPPNMKLNKILVKMVPIKTLLYINSFIQEKNSNKKF